MKTTKQEYIKAHPKSKLAERLIATDWSDGNEVYIGGGLDAPYNKNSNLYKALALGGRKEYILGGHRRCGSEGWWFAVRV